MLRGEEGRHDRWRVGVGVREPAVQREDRQLDAGAIIAHHHFMAACGGI